ncbi:hypothetical protein SISNIDRAFT_453417 [Sistotremastrum niveocremeum HHB9708]|uniref:Uncharacterized protein n=1 Tax=Sistotremastrum niveocremeum HHB9708 TaxID=1314777 RepID=A0A164VUX0_9AGAM|nr:hypothetical protein SISNIDRAFT_453417 [Sistotremastrum niveocremeum HHB9708]
MEKRHSHYHWHYPGVVVVKGSPSPDIIIESGHSAVVHVRRHHHEHIHIDSDHHGEVKDIDIDRRTIGNFGPAGAPWKRDDSGTPGMIDIFSSSMKVASLVLQQTNDTSGNSMFVMNASNGNNTGTVLKMVPVFNNSTLSSKRGDSNTTMVNFQMISPNSLDVFCMTFDPNPPAALPMTAEPCNNTVTLHKSQEFIHNAGTGAIAPLWNNSVPSSASKRQQPAESPSGAQNVTLIFTPVVESAQPSNKQLVATFLPGNGTTSSDPDSGDSQDSSDGEADSTDSPDGMSSTDTTTFSTSTDPSSTPASTSASPDSQPTDGTDPNSIYQEDVLPSNSVGSTTMSMTASFSTTMATETTDAMQTQTPSTTMTSTGPSSTDVADSSSPSPTGGAQQSFEWMFNAGM